MTDAEFETIADYIVDIPVHMLEYFDVDSDKNGSEKARVLTELHNGKRLEDIDGWEKAFELLPSVGHWD